MKKFKLINKSEKLLADTCTPVGLYLALRDRYPGSLLLESSDYHGAENSSSFICLDPVAFISVSNEGLELKYPDGKTERRALSERHAIMNELRVFRGKFDTRSNQEKKYCGLFGYTGYEAVKYFEDIDLETGPAGKKSIPWMYYALYRFIIVIDHFKDEMTLVRNIIDDKEETEMAGALKDLMKNKSVNHFHFYKNGRERSSITDEDFIGRVRNGKEQCRKGNIFQVVLSREFEQDFKGDEFNVYRALRSINPSPYLFYFEYNNFRIFGSSPEAQLVVKNRVAEIHPIAGTVKRTGNEVKDQELAMALKNDKKEMAEHVMLVDLARNDLSRSCREVEVEVFSEIQYFSHVIHLVSKVTGKLKEKNDPLQVFANTFPAGTLSGAPKHRAMQLIADCERDERSYYGGAIGYFGFDGEVNHAIIIRSFLSCDNTLYYRAGAGVVIASSDENELQEVNNKLAALRSAMEMAEKI